jgi:MFS family permease
VSVPPRGGRRLLSPAVALAALVGRAVRAAASDVSPLRESPHFRRLFVGQAVSLVGTQVTQVAVPLQVYAISRSSLAVGAVGLAGLVPLVVFGLYGGSIADAVDRRRLMLATSTGTTAVTLVLLVHAALHLDRLSVLFACAAAQAGFAAVDDPTRRAVIPQLVAPNRLAAANTLVYGRGELAVIVGPLLAGVAVGAGFQWAYAIDVASFGAALYATLRLPPLPPGDGARQAGLASVAEGLRFVAARPVLLMTFLVDVDAMLFATPRALFPALAAASGGPRTAGLFYAAPAVGAVVVTLLGGALARVHRQGLGVVVAIGVWGVAVTLFGLAPTLGVALLMLAVAGAADTVSAVYRATILQVATPPGMQGRLHGVHTVVVTGGPRLGDLRAGGMASAFSPAVAVVAGGLACVAGIALLALAVPAFVRYDARTAAAGNASPTGPAAAPDPVEPGPASP